MSKEDKPDKALHYVIGFSGGKDSTATWLHLTRTLKLPRVTCTFADTGHESPIVHDYLDLLEREHGLPLVRVRPVLADLHGELVPEKICQRLGLDVNDLGWLKEPLNMERLAIIKRRFPSAMARFCTTLLKLRPQSRWMRQNCNASECVHVTGVRADESAARAKLPEHDDDKLFGCPAWRPLIRWTAADVFAIHRRYDVPPNPLYMHGMSRVGCFPCVMARKSELTKIAARYPEAFDRLEAMEKQVAEAIGKPFITFFSPDKVSRSYRTHRDEASGKAICTADDVRRWALGDLARDVDEGLFRELDDQLEIGDQPLCESQYGLCE